MLGLQGSGHKGYLLLGCWDTSSQSPRCHFLCLQVRRQPPLLPSPPPQVPQSCTCVKSFIHWPVFEKRKKNKEGEKLLCLAMQLKNGSVYRSTSAVVTSRLLFNASSPVPSESVVLQATSTLLDSRLSSLNGTVRVLNVTYLSKSCSPIPRTSLARSGHVVPGRIVSC